MTTRTTRLSWARFPHYPQAVHPIAWLDLAHPQWGALHRPQGTTLAFGNGRSYGDSCLAQSGHVLEMCGLDRIIDADWERGMIHAEPGITLEQILEVAIPRGWILPVMPGTKLRRFFRYFSSGARTTGASAIGNDRISDRLGVVEAYFLSSVDHRY